MRSVFVFPAMTKEAATEVILGCGIRLDPAPATSQPGERQFLWAEFVDDLSDFDDGMQAAIKEELREAPGWAVEITLSGARDVRAESAIVASRLLADGGCAVDDHDRIWTSDDLQVGGQLPGGWGQ